MVSLLKINLGIKTNKNNYQKLNEIKHLENLIIKKVIEFDKLYINSFDLFKELKIVFPNNKNKNIGKNL